MALCHNQQDSHNSHHSQTQPDFQVFNSHNLPAFSKPLSMANKQARLLPIHQSGHSSLNPQASRTPCPNLLSSPNPQASTLSFRLPSCHNQPVHCHQPSFRAHCHRHRFHRSRKASSRCSHLYRKRRGPLHPSGLESTIQRS